MTDFLSEADAFEQASKAPANGDVLPDYSESATALSDPFYEFKLDRYQVSEDEYEKYGIIPLTRGYFAVVSTEDYGAVIRQKWTANVQKCPKTGRIIKIYAVRSGSAKEVQRGAPGYVYLHREVTKTIYAGRKVIIDHKNGISLDCRGSNLRHTDQGNNIANIADNKVTQRTKHHGIPRGVEVIKRKHRHVYRATVYVRGKRLRAKTVFSCPERAGRWFRRMNALLNPEAYLANDGNGLPPPIKFPPLAEICTDVPF